MSVLNIEKSKFMKPLFRLGKIATLGCLIAVSVVAGAAAVSNVNSATPDSPNVVQAASSGSVMVGIPTPMGKGTTESVATIMARESGAPVLLQETEADADINRSPYADRVRALNQIGRAHV